MEKADLDFANLDFKYRKVDGNIRYFFKNGQWDNGTLHEEETVDLHIASTCLHYGQNCFEGMKVFETKDGSVVCFRPEENYLRLKKSAEKILMEPVPKEVFFDALERVVKANKRFIPPYGTSASLYIRPILLGISPHIGLSRSEDYLFMMMVTPVGPYFKGGFKPVKMLVAEDLDRAAPYGLGDIKAAGNYAAGLRGAYRAKSTGFTDVIYLDCIHRKFIDESGPANFIGILKDGTFVTPYSGSILPSITNMTLRTIAENEFGWKVEQRPVDINEISNFAEAGCCGTAAIITPVGSIRYRDKDYNFYNEGKDAGPKITALYEHLYKLQYGEIEDKYNWLYKIDVK
ncbi:MAG: branched chain amino acid aminotransferase [Spirochaetes bacterium GWF1_31_7]|nr:MAG: branched chain amino acid aminotransferase [Spirochaetes bacterium GWE1_32_154]OHD48299.1 MAG: branched chain amino acid aminotransferase [Spirochaetes bacterium GWE2_31_10]OHD49287.1 MAG: branched chain amino acid aminotransferase [Spirochaetes bacterium GWF1_31_7]OHD83443.1 MAG: branched chain amino acid aminotransferase [Spirochaetes bacterium RIFOXYB1_FULL_32_8]HBI37636.1 branched chain amino acid aminotransferase [Spirochaetia bacterium]